MELVKASMTGAVLCYTAKKQRSLLTAPYCLWKLTPEAVEPKSGEEEDGFERHLFRLGEDRSERMFGSRTGLKK